MNENETDAIISLITINLFYLKKKIKLNFVKCYDKLIIRTKLTFQNINVKIRINKKLKKTV